MPIFVESGRHFSSSLPYFGAIAEGPLEVVLTIPLRPLPRPLETDLPYGNVQRERGYTEMETRGRADKSAAETGLRMKGSPKTPLF